MDTYEIIDDFQARGSRVLVLDRNYDPRIDKLTIDGEEYRYLTNSVRSWIIIKSTKSFKGKTAVFTQIHPPRSCPLTPAEDEE